MGRVSEADVRAIFGFLGAARIGGQTDPIPAATLVQLRDLLHADDADYFELRRADRAVLGMAESDEAVLAPGSEAAMHAFGHQNPVNWRRWNPDDGVLRLSERVRRHDFVRTEFHDGFMRPNGFRDILKVWLWSSPESAACIQLWRHDSDFARRDQDVLAVLHHHLIAMRSYAMDRGAAQRASASGLTVREAQILTWAARGESDSEIAARLGVATRTVRKHLEHAYLTLGVHSRTEAIGRILVPVDDGALPH